MTAIKWTFWLFPLTLSALWLLADSLMPDPVTYFAFRAVFVQYTGVLGMGMMSLAMLLSIRPRWIEQPLRGLDKMYRLHKWLGMAGLSLSTIHWWWAQGSKWMVGWGWLDKPVRSGPSEQTLSQLEQLLRGQRGLAESLGEWAFYVVVILIILALTRAFSYSWFKKTHKLIVVAYLVLVCHSLVLTEFDYWSQPVGWVLAALLIGGVISASSILTGRRGRKRQVQGVIKVLTSYPGVRAIEGTVLLNDGWEGHKPGQFAFVTSNSSEGPHPYTIASAWSQTERSLTFIIKELGDWTGQLGDRLKEGMAVTVEGPYGCFDFIDPQPRQIWVGAGIGITPFIAKMKHLAQQPGAQEIDLFHVTAEIDQTAITKLRADARTANVQLHLRVTPQDGRLTPEHIRAAVPEWSEASLWFCGPSAFGDALRRDFLNRGLAVANYHQELFEMR
ncbi:MAG: putative ferric reductase [Motiliproteus sp.]|jgi:predicted ferric reductase